MLKLHSYTLVYSILGACAALPGQQQESPNHTDQDWSKIAPNDPGIGLLEEAGAFLAKLGKATADPDLKIKIADTIRAWQNGKFGCGNAPGSGAAWTLPDRTVNEGDPDEECGFWQPNSGNKIALRWSLKRLDAGGSTIWSPVSKADGHAPDFMHAQLLALTMMHEVCHSVGPFELKRTRAVIDEDTWASDAGLVDEVDECNAIFEHFLIHWSDYLNLVDMYKLMNAGALFPAWSNDTEKANFRRAINAYYGRLLLDFGVMKHDPNWFWFEAGLEFWEFDTEKPPAKIPL
jgi:hypothetical protein